MLSITPSPHHPGPPTRPFAPPSRLLERVLYWTGGQPYLTQRLCRAVAEAVRDQAGGTRDGSETSSHASSLIAHPSLVDRLCDALFLSRTAREADDNLAFVRNRLLRGDVDLAGLLDLYRKVRQGKPVKDDETNPLATALRLSGVVRAVDGTLQVRNRIYDRVFDREWILTHTPGAELRRQRAAYRRGLLRAAGVSAAVLAVVGSLAVTAVHEARRANRIARQEAAQRRLAQEGQRALRQILYAERLNLAQQSEEEGNVARAQQLLETLRPEPGQEDLRGFEWRYLWRRAQGDARATLHGHGSLISTVAFSADSKLLATSSDDSSVRLWDVARRQQIAVLNRHRGAVVCLAFSPDGKTVASGGDDKLVRLWDVASRRQVAALKGHKDRIHVLAFSPDGRLLASGSLDKTVRLWAVDPSQAAGRQPGASGGNGGRRPTINTKQPAAWQTIATLKGYTAFWHSLAFSADSKLLVTGTVEGPIRLWDVAGYRAALQTWSKTGPRLVATLRANSVAIGCAAFSPDGKTLATGHWDDGIRLWDLATRREVTTLWGHTNGIEGVAFSPDGKTLASCSDDSTIKLWDLATRQELTTFKGHKGAVSDISFSPDGKILASGGVDRTVKLWDPATRAATTTMMRQKAAIFTVAFSPDGRALAAGSGDGTVRLWDVASRRELTELRGHRSVVASLAFSPDGKLLASGSDDHTLKLWDLASRRAVVSLPGFQGGLWGVAFSPDGRTLALQGQKEVKLWDLAAKRVTATFSWDPKGNWCLAFSPDGRTLAAFSSPGVITLWDVATHRAGGTISGSDPFLFFPDGKTLAASLISGGVKLWDLASQRPVATLRSHTQGVGAIALSPDERTLAAASANGVTLFNVATRQEAAALKGHAGAVIAIAFSPDGNTVASAGLDGTVRLWHAATFQEADPLQVVSSTSDRSVALQWQPLPSAVAYNIYRGPAGADRTQLVKLAALPAAAASFTDRSPMLVNGRPQTYAAAAVFPAATGKTVEGPRVTLQATPVAVPGWSGSSINEGLHSGSAVFDGPTGAILVRGSGADIWDTADEFYYLCQPVQGNFQVTVRALTRPKATDPWAKAGLMIRESLAPGSRDAYLITSAANGLAFQWRGTTNDFADHAAVLTDQQLKLPILLRLTRQGDIVTASFSRDGGKQFQPAGHPLPYDEPLPRTLYAGLAITAHNAGLFSEARFNDLRVEALPR